MKLCDAMGNGCPVPADWWNVPKNLQDDAQEFLEELEELNDDLNSNDPGRQMRAALELLLFAATIRAGGGEGEGLRLKPVNLPAWRDVDIDMGHISSGHMEGESRVSADKTLFPSSWDSGQVESAVRGAYRYSRTIRSQGDKVLVVGPGPIGTNIRIEMWVNKSTRTIETAYPIYQ